MSEYVFNEIKKECLQFFTLNPFSIEDEGSLQIKVGRKAEVLSRVLAELTDERKLTVVCSGQRYLYQFNRDQKNAETQEAEKQTSTAQRDLTAHLNKLTKREKDIIRLLIQGKNNQDIADTLFISPHTVKNHVSNIYFKLKINDRYELISLLYQWQTEAGCAI